MVEKWLHKIAKTGNYNDLSNKPQTTTEANVDSDTILATARSVKKVNDIANNKADKTHTHTKAQISDMPTSMKNPTSLTVQFNGTTNKTYDGSSAQTVNITPSAIGASPSNHAHNYAGSSSAGGAANTANKLTTARNIRLSDNITGNANFDGGGDITINARLTRQDLTGKTIDLNTLNHSDGTYSRRYIETTTGGCANISNAPIKEPFILDVELIRYSSSSDYISKQTFTSATTKRVYERYCTNGTWTGWNQVYTTSNKPTKADVGLGNVDNTSDANKPISTATQNALNNKANLSHNHDDRYFTKSVIQEAFSKRATTDYGTYKPAIYGEYGDRLDFDSTGTYYTVGKLCFINIEIEGASYNSRGNHVTISLPFTAETNAILPIAVDTWEIDKAIYGIAQAGSSTMKLCEPPGYEEIQFDKLLKFGDLKCTITGCYYIS